MMALKGYATFPCILIRTLKLRDEMLNNVFPDTQSECSSQDSHPDLPSSTRLHGARNDKTVSLVLKQHLGTRSAKQKQQFLQAVSSSYLEAVLWLKLIIARKN